MTKFGRLSVYLLSPALLLVATEANSAWRRQAAAGSCTWNYYGSNPVAGQYVGSGTANHLMGYNGDGASYMQVVCPALDDSWFPRTSVTTLNIEGYAQWTSTSASAQLCASDWDSYGGWCSSAYTSSGTGHFTLAPSRTYWGSTYSGDFGYIIIDLNGEYVSLAGIFYGS